MFIIVFQIVLLYIMMMGCEVYEDTQVDQQQGTLFRVDCAARKRGMCPLDADIPFIVNQAPLYPKDLMYPVCSALSSAFTHVRRGGCPGAMDSSKNP